MHATANPLKTRLRHHHRSLAHLKSPPYDVQKQKTPRTTSRSCLRSSTECPHIRRPEALIMKTCGGNVSAVCFRYFYDGLDERTYRPPSADSFASTTALRNAITAFYFLSLSTTDLTTAGSNRSLPTTETKLALSLSYAHIIWVFS